MFHGDAQHTGTAAFAGPRHGRVAWKFAAGAPVRSSPTVAADGTVFFGSDAGRLHAVGGDGRERASIALGGRVWAAPLWRGGRLFVGTESQHFYAVNFTTDPAGVATLAVAWKYKTGDFILGSAVPLGDDVIVGSWDGGLYRFSQASGEKRWRYGKRGDMESSPAVSLDGALVYGGSRDRKLHAVDAGRGRVKWKARAKDSINSSPCVARDGTVLVGTDDGRLLALDDRGRRRWSFGAEADVVSSPALSPDQTTVYVGSHDGHLYALDAATGALRWKRALDVVWSSPAVDAAGQIYVGAWDGKLYALSPTGEVRWTVATGAPIWSSPALAPGRLYIGSNDGHVYAIE